LAFQSKAEKKMSSHHFLSDRINAQFGNLQSYAQRQIHPQELFASQTRRLLQPIPRFVSMIITKKQQRVPQQSTCLQMLMTIASIAANNFTQKYVASAAVSVVV
jgi:hypothetical protein